MIKSRMVTLALVGVVISGFAKADISEKVSATALGGITEVNVVVEHLPQGATAIGLTKEQIQTDVELKLRLAGMRITTEVKTGTGNPYLYVVVNLTDTASAASVDIQLCQDIVLDRNKKAWIPGVATWETGSVMANATAHNIRDSVKDHIDRLLNAWLAANPRSSVR